MREGNNNHKEATLILTKTTDLNANRRIGRAGSPKRRENADPSVRDRRAVSTKIDRKIGSRATLLASIFEAGAAIFRACLGVGRAGASGAVNPAMAEQARSSAAEKAATGLSGVAVTRMGENREESMRITATAARTGTTRTIDNTMGGRMAILGGVLSDLNIRDSNFRASTARAASIRCIGSDAAVRETTSRSASGGRLNSAASIGFGGDAAGVAIKIGDSEIAAAKDRRARRVASTAA